jgi:uncharacterized membrane protein (UPF0127 family)
MSKSHRFPARLLLVLAAAAVLVAVPGCGGEKPVEQKTVADYFPVKLGDRVARLQFAVLPNEQQRGLMERPELGADDGMIFVYGQPQQMGFWMRNTLIPLDIGFFNAQGELREVRQMFPRDERTVKSRGADLQFAIEMNQNWFRDRGVKPGAKLDLAAVKAALQARGFEPRRFGIE